MAAHFYVDPRIHGELIVDDTGVNQPLETGQTAETPAQAHEPVEAAQPAPLDAVQAKPEEPSETVQSEPADAVPAEPEASPQPERVDVVQTDPVETPRAEPAGAVQTGHVEPAQIEPLEDSQAEQEIPRNWIAEWCLMAIALLFAMTGLVQSYVIPTVSMESTLIQGDHLLVDKLAYAPIGRLSRYLLPYERVKRGDVVVFRYPVDIRQNYVKRCIGIPGDRIKVVNKRVFVNGKELNEPYAIHRTPYIDSYRDNFPSYPNVHLAEPALIMMEKNVVKGEVVVPQGQYFMMGDNRDNSLDSRYWGFVPRENIVGKPLLIFWSYDAPTEQLADPNFMSKAHLIDLAKNFFRKTRWNRCFQLIHGYPLN